MPTKQFQVARNTFIYFCLNIKVNWKVHLLKEKCIKCLEVFFFKFETILTRSILLVLFPKILTEHLLLTLDSFSKFVANFISYEHAHTHTIKLTFKYILKRGTLES